MELDFYEILANYPVDESPCSNKNGYPHFENQCAIRMSVALERSGLGFHSYNGVKCWFGCKETHALRVEELDLFLAAKLGKPEVFYKTSFDKFPKETGIVVFFDFWARKEGDALTGDHFDLFDGMDLIDGDLEYFERARKIHFWRID